MNDLGKAFSFPFKDPAWVSKFVLAALFMLLAVFLVGIFILAGYLVRVTQRVMRREENVLPEWADVGVMLIVGFKFCVTYLIYLLPMLLLYVPFLIMVVMGKIVDNGASLETIAGLYFVVVIFLLVIPYSLVFTLLSPIIAYRFAERERISDALDIGGVFKAFTRNWQSTAVVALIGMGLSSLATIGVVFFIIGILFTIFYAYLVMAYMNGLLYVDQAKEQGIA
jgi:hypothetical protein